MVKEIGKIPHKVHKSCRRLASKYVGHSTSIYFIVKGTMQSLQKGCGPCSIKYSCVTLVCSTRRRARIVSNLIFRWFDEDQYPISFFYLKKFICSPWYLLNIIPWFLLLLVHLPFNERIELPMQNTLTCGWRATDATSGSSVSLPIPLCRYPAQMNASVLRSQVHNLQLYKSHNWVIYIRAMYNL